MELTRQSEDEGEQGEKKGYRQSIKEKGHNEIKGSFEDMDSDLCH